MNEVLVTSWDPLETAIDIDKDVVASAKKREIKNILKSYVSNYDPFSELIQNAMDAVERRCNNEKEHNPKLFIQINLLENSVEIADNGCGFEESEFKSFLAPSISFKSGGKTRGNKGVGVTYIAYGFNQLFIRTKNNHFSYQGLIRRGREWIEDSDGSVSRPKVEKTETKSELFDSLDQGSSFKIIFTGNHIRPSNLKWYQAQTAEQWLYLLLLKTPLGTIMLPQLAEHKIKFDLSVIDVSGDVTTISNESAAYKFPHFEISASQKLSDIKKAQINAVTTGGDILRATMKYKNSNGIYEIYDTEKLIELAKLSQEEIQLCQRYNTSAYGYFAYSTEVWDQLNDRKAKLRKGLRILRGGLQIANNCMIQGDNITIPLTKNIGHQNQAHIIVHFEGADPDLGRKGFQPELKDLAEKLSVAIVRELSNQRTFLKSDSGAQANIEKEIKVQDWLKEREEHEKECPLILNNEIFFLPTKKISIGSIPQSEQDVIVLFNQLIAGGVIRGIRLMSTSQSSQYDGVFRFCAENPLEHLYFDKNTNPLGVYSEQLLNTYKSHPKILEYKFSLDGLIREFESGVKHEVDVELAIFWDMGIEYIKKYNVISLLDFENIHHRQHHGITHILSSATNSHIYVICLKELFELLNDAKLAQLTQKNKYSNDI
ncbi:ATP-binding protein [Rahnella variigena]|uniref:ATP-binding protein n=1 Tax=Rahnella variigena TaxID=574964 RepID=UPI001330A38B|nr:ATP-binding protein [Rahnella variigena]